MEAGEVGIKIRVDAIVDLVGSTVRNLRVQGPTDLTPRDLVMFIDTPSTFAARITVAADFPVTGNYVIQLQVTFSDGRILKSPPQIQHVQTML